MARKTGTKKCISANGGGGLGAGVEGGAGGGGGGGGKLEWRTDVILISYNTQIYKLERDKNNSKKKKKLTNTNTEYNIHRVTLRQKLPTIVRLAFIHISYFSHQIQKHLRFPQ